MTASLVHLSADKKNLSTLLVYGVQVVFAAREVYLSPYFFFFSQENKFRWFANLTLYNFLILWVVSFFSFFTG